MHIRAVFAKPQVHDICLSAKTSFIGYPSVRLLGQRVDALGLILFSDREAKGSSCIYGRKGHDIDMY